MTAQQIDYWKLQESTRANKATEAENAKYHRNSEQIQTAMNAETKRHNMSMESINRANLDIAARNAAVNELNAQTNARLANLTALRDAEVARHNSVLEGIQKSYNDATLALTGKKLYQEYEMSALDRQSKEGISSLDRASREYIAELDRAFRLGQPVVNSMLTSASAPTVVSGGGRTGSGKQLPSVVTVPRQTFSATGSQALIGSSTAVGGSALSAVALPVALGMAGGLVVGAIVAKNNVKPFTPTFNNKEIQKGVKWYGAE